MGAIEVDEYMQTSTPDVFAIGDCATSLVHRVKGTKYLPHASEALRQGRVAAMNLLEPKVKITPSEGTYNMNMFDRSLCMTGLSETRAKAQGLDCRTVHLTNTTLDGQAYVDLWMVYEKGTHKLLGLQAEGTAESVEADADIFSLALQRDCTLEDLEYMDMYFKHNFKNPYGTLKMLAETVRQIEREEQNKQV